LLRNEGEAGLLLPLLLFLAATARKDEGAFKVMRHRPSFQKFARLFVDKKKASRCLKGFA